MYGARWPRIICCCCRERGGRRFRVKQRGRRSTMSWRDRGKECVGKQFYQRARSAKGLGQQIRRLLYFLILRASCSRPSYIYIYIFELDMESSYFIYAFFSLLFFTIADGRRDRNRGGWCCYRSSGMGRRVPIAMRVSLYIPGSAGGMEITRLHVVVDDIKLFPLLFSPYFAV